MKRVSLVFTLALAAGLSTQAATAQTLKTIKDRGMLSCGVSQGLPGFSSPDDKGNWTGLDVDICRASRPPSSTIRQDQVRAAVGQGSLHGAAVRRNLMYFRAIQLDAFSRHHARRQFTGVTIMTVRASW